MDREWRGTGMAGRASGDAATRDRETTRSVTGEYIFFEFLFTIGLSAGNYVYVEFE